MKFRTLQLLTLICLARVCLAQAPVPSNTYMLHAQKERQIGFGGGWALPSTEVVATTDHALLVFIPQTKEKWVLKRLYGWDTSHPQEQTLTIEGSPRSEKNVSVTTNMILDPSGPFLLLRINSSWGGGGWDSDKPILAEAVIYVIDLRTFTIMSRRVTSDSLLANSHWRFSKDNQLISKGTPTQVSTKTSSVRTSIDTYDVAVLMLPGLVPAISCQYDEVSEFRLKGPNEFAPTAKHVSDGCAALLRTVGLSSPEDLLGLDEMVPKDMPKEQNGCYVKSVNSEKTLAVEECKNEVDFADGDFAIINRRWMNVRSIPDGKTVFSVHLPRNWQLIPGLVVFANGQNYLVILQDGIKLATYPLR
jgi:hypothetical protein